MTNLRLQRRRERALLIEGVLDDPRWEKLAAGEATPEEIADLKAWARQSKTAQKALDMFLPPTDAEFEIRSVELVRTLVHREVGQRRDKVRLTNLFAGNPPHGDRRMMAKHQTSRPQLAPQSSPYVNERASRGTRPLRPKEEKAGRKAFIPEKPLPSVLEGRTPPVPVVNRKEPIVVEAIAGVGDSSGNTSRRIALVRETTNPPSARAASTNANGWVHQVKRFSALQPWFGPLFVCLSFAMFVGALVWKDRASRSPNVLMAQPVSLAETPEVSEAFPISSSEHFEASPGIQASFVVPNHASMSVMPSMTNAPVAPLAKPPAPEPRSLSPRFVKKAPVEPPKNCMGFGVFKRCN